MSEVAYEEVNIVQSWHSMCSLHQGRTTAFQDLENNYYVATHQSEDGFISALYYTILGDYSIYCANGHTFLSADPQIEGTILSDQVCDLCDEGDRWEGDALDSTPCGWGSLYDSDNRLVYEGFMFGDVKTLWGRKYHADIRTVEYEGCLCNNHYMGQGKLINREGECLYDGIWLYGKQMSNIVSVMRNDKQLLSLHNMITSLSFCKGCDIPSCKLFFFFFPLLKDILIIGHYRSNPYTSDDGDGSFIVMRCPSLESMRFVTNACVKMKKFVCRGAFSISI